MSTNKCLKHLLALFFYILIATTTAAYASDTQSSKRDTVSTIWCMKQIETVAKKENECGSKLSEARIKLAKSDKNKTGLTEKVGIFALGAGVALTNFNPLALIAAGYLIIFQ